MTTNDIYAFTLALAAALAAGLMSGFALMKRMTLAGDVMSHIALPGLGLAILWNANPVIGAAATLALGALIIWNVERTTALPYETTVGIVFSASLAIGALITPSEDLIEALFGGGGAVSLQTLLAFLAISAAVISFLWLNRSRLVLSVFNPELAEVSGVRVASLNLLFLLAFAATLLVGLRYLGALLVGALIIIPGAIARQYTHTLWTFLSLSAIASILSVALGFMLAQTFNLQTGPTVIALASAAFFLSLLKKKK